MNSSTIKNVAGRSVLRSNYVLVIVTIIIYFLFLIVHFSDQFFWEYVEDSSDQRSRHIFKNILHGKHVKLDKEWAIQSISGMQFLDDYQGLRVIGFSIDGGENFDDVEPSQPFPEHFQDAIWNGDFAIRLSR